MADDRDEDGAPAPALGYETPRWVATPAAEVGALVLRLLGLKTLVDLLLQLGQLPGYFLYTGTSTGILSPWLPILIAIVWQATLAAILFAGARPIAEAVFGRRTVAAHDLGTGAWMMLIVSGLGLAFALFSLDDAVRAAILFGARIQANIGRPIPQAIEGAQLVALLAPIMKVGVGVLLFFRPSLIVTPWLRGTDRAAS